MSGAAIIQGAAAGELPAWAQATPERREHMDRVAALMGEWAAGLGLEERDRVRWTAAGRLHDSYRDAQVDTMGPWVDGCFADLPDSFLHGPAAARHLAEDGVEDAELLDAIRFHTLGNHELGALGRALIAADFLDPGRSSMPEWRARQRERMPGELDGVTAAVVRAKLEHGFARGMPLRLEMVRLWNVLASG